MAEPLVVGRDVTREFPAGDRDVRQVLAACSCRVMPGDRIALTGPSGSGKSTLLTILGGLDKPTSGEVAWPGLRSAARDPAAEIDLRPPGVAFVFQSPSLLPALDVRQNVCLPLMLAGHAQDMEAQADRMLAAFDLGSLADKLPGELSGGQAQRVAMARALMTRPRLILADEPTGQLDHPTAKQVLDVTFELLANWDNAIVIASHDDAVAARMRRTWTLDHGKFATASPDQSAALPEGELVP